MLAGCSFVPQATRMEVAQPKLRFVPEKNPGRMVGSSQVIQISTRLTQVSNSNRVPPCSQMRMIYLFEKKYFLTASARTHTLP